MKYEYIISSCLIVHFFLLIWGTDSACVDVCGWTRCCHIRGRARRINTRGNRGQRGLRQTDILYHCRSKLWLLLHTHSHLSHSVYQSSQNQHRADKRKLIQHSIQIWQTSTHKSLTWPNKTFSGSLSRWIHMEPPLSPNTVVTRSWTHARID